MSQCVKLVKPLPPLHRWACCVSGTLNGSSKVSRSSEPRNNTWSKMSTAVWKKGAWVQLNDEMRIKEPRRRDSPSHPQLKSASWPHTGAGCLKETTQMGVRSKTGGWSHSKPSLSRSWAPRRPRPPPPSHVSGDTVEKSARLLEIPILSCARSHFRNDCINWA